MDCGSVRTGTTLESLVKRPRAMMTIMETLLARKSLRLTSQNSGCLKINCATRHRCVIRADGIAVNNAAFSGGVTRTRNS